MKVRPRNYAARKAHGINGVSSGGIGMIIDGLDHVTIRVRPAQVDAMQAFYANLLGMDVGPRPLTFPGAWLYAGGRAVVHIAGNVAEPADVQAEQQPTGFDHVAFQAKDLAAAKVRLDSAGVPWREVWRPHLEILQLVLHDPAGVKVELTFDPAEHPDRRHPSRE